mgnify:CR=1 FL=1
MAKVTELTAELAGPIVAGNGCTLWDVEYVKEAGAWYLRVYIDKAGGVSIDDCEAVARPLSDALDEADPIEGSYVLEVSSAGADRPLKKPAHFQQFLGAEVDVRLYRPLDGRKEYTGVLKVYDGGDVTIETAGEARTFVKKDVAQVRLTVHF